MTYVYLGYMIIPFFSFFFLCVWNFKNLLMLMICINHLAFNMLKPTMKISTLKFSLFVVKVLLFEGHHILWQSIHRSSYSRLNINSRCVGLGMLNAKELNQIIKDVDQNITNKHHLHELFKTIIEYQNPDLE